jgi:two-component system, LytTR family, sensor kinase
LRAADPSDTFAKKDPVTYRTMKFFWKYIFPVLYALVFYTLVRLVTDLTDHYKFWERPWQQNALEIGSVVLLSFGTVRLPLYFFRKFSKRNRRPSAKSVFLEFGEILLTALVLATVATVLIHLVTKEPLFQINDLVIANVLVALLMLLHYAIIRGNSFIRAFIEQKVLVEKVKNDQLLTELKFLKAQYHPHFLFNALNTIYFQMDEDVAAAKQSVEKFSELLRYQLYDQQQTVPVNQEVRYLANYIQLQQTRSSEKLELEVDFDEALDGQQVYPLLFLPLVENAFKYVGGSYRLKIVACLQGDIIRLEVENSVPNQIPIKKEKGIGLENLKRRLELLYPGRHDLIAEKKGNTFVAILTLQYH